MIIKKLLFAIPFIIFFALFSWFLSNFLQNTNDIFGLNFSALIQTIYLLILLLISGMFFIIFAALANDFRLTLPISFLASLLPLFLITPSLSLILSLGFLVCFILSLVFLNKKMVNYLTFKPGALFIPSVNQLVTMILLISSLAYYFTLSSDIQKHGFKVPDSIIDLSLQFMPQENVSQPGQTSLNSLQIPADQISLLKQNPELLKQYGLDPAILDTVTKQPVNTPLSTKDLVKPLVQQQIQDIVNPHLQLLVIVMTVLVFFSLNWLSSFLSLLLYPLIWFIFWLLEKTGFISFVTEDRPVKKLVV